MFFNSSINGIISLFWNFFQNNNYMAGIMSICGISSIWFTLKTILAEQLPNIPNVSSGTSMIAAIGSFTAALLAALLKQGNTIKNIDENIDKNVALIKESVALNKELLETQVKIVRKDDEKFDILISILKRDEERFDTFIKILKLNTEQTDILLKQNSEKSDTIINTLKKINESHDSLVAKIVSMEDTNIVKFRK